MRNLLILSFFMSCIASFGQEDSNDPKVIQLSGMVLTGDSLEPVQFTTVYRQRDKRGTISDLEGFFSLSAYEGDTIMFSNIGFYTSQYVIPEELEGNRYSMVQMMFQDTISIPMAQIFPWPSTRNKFKQEFLAMDLPQSQDDYLTFDYAALYNYDGMIDVESDKAASYSTVMNQRYQSMYYAGQHPTSGLLNPIAWAQFIKSLKNGELKRQ